MCKNEPVKCYGFIMGYYHSCTHKDHVISIWLGTQEKWICLYAKKYVAINGALYATENLVTDKEPMWVFEASTLPPHPSPSHSLHFFGFLFSLVAASLFLPVHICCCFGVVMHDLCTNFANAVNEIQILAEIIVLIKQCTICH